MTTIKRFTPDYAMHAARFEPFAREAEHGEYVRFDAHQQEVSTLKAERDALEVRLRNALTSEQEAIQRAHAANQTANALAVENAALKSRSIKLFNLGYLRGHESTVEGYFVDVHRSDIDTYHDDVVAEIIEDEDETPATEAALAAIQAQGVEKAATALDALSAQSASATTQGNFRAAAVYLRTTVLPAVGEAK